jgi:hypothetical protein
VKFTKATKRKARARIALAGPSGSGKTYSALSLATHLNAGSIALLDTEHGSASKYADIFDFDALDMAPPYHPDRFVEAIAAAAAAGYGVLILDSLSHAWNGSGGLLEIVDEIGRRLRSQNSFAAWKDATPIQNRLVEAMLTAPLHIIATMRSKQEYVLEQVERNGRTVTQPKKVGMAPVQRDSFEYEFDIFAEMTVENDLIISKTRCPLLAGRVFPKPGIEPARTIAEWLSSGADAVVEVLGAKYTPAEIERITEPKFIPVKGGVVDTDTGEVTESAEPIATLREREMLERYVLQFVDVEGMTPAEKKNLTVATNLVSDENAQSKHVQEGIKKLDAMLNKYKPLPPIEAELRTQALELGEMANAHG